MGWGESTLGGKEAAVRELILDFGHRYVIGHNPFNIEYIWFNLYQIEHNTGPIMYAAMAGIETVLWDIVEKASGQPDYNLVGGKVRSKVKVYANGRYHHDGDDQELAHRARALAARGYIALKFDPFGLGGRDSPREELRRATSQVEAVRKAESRTFKSFWSSAGDSVPSWRWKRCAPWCRTIPAGVRNPSPHTTTNRWLRWWRLRPYVLPRVSISTPAMVFSTSCSERPRTWFSRTSPTVVAS